MPGLDFPIIENMPNATYINFNRVISSIKINNLMETLLN